MDSYESSIAIYGINLKRKFHGIITCFSPHRRE